MYMSSAVARIMPQNGWKFERRDYDQTPDAEYCFVQTWLLGDQEVKVYYRGSRVAYGDWIARIEHHVSDTNAFMRRESTDPDGVELFGLLTLWALDLASLTPPEAVSQ